MELQKVKTEEFIGVPFLAIAISENNDTIEFRLKKTFTNVDNTSINRPKFLTVLKVDRRDVKTVIFILITQRKIYVQIKQG